MDGTINNYSEKKNYFKKWGGVKSILKYNKGEAAEKVDISICIPTFNRVDELAKAVQSVNLQEKTRLVWNLIIVDNELSEIDENSPKKKLLEAVEGISIKYYQNEKNIGLFGNWNRCIELADGKWISMLHDDDLLDSDYLRTIENIIADIDYKSVAYIKTGARTEKSASKSKKELIRLRHRCKLIRYRMSDIELLGPASVGILGAPTCGTLISKQAFIKSGGYNEEHYPCEDAYMPVKLINLYGYKVYRTVGDFGTYQWNDNTSYRKETLMGDARELNSYLEYYSTWGKIARCCYKLFRNEIIWMAYGGMEKLVRESKYIDDKEIVLRELQDTIGMPKERKLCMKIYILFRRLHSWTLIGKGILFGRNYAKNKKST
jgi:glycosyltransferase involved in cell wall biosynthesis